MKRNALFTGRFALTGVALAALWLTAPSAWALGLGRLTVQSPLGETLRAEIDITSMTPEEASSLRVRVAPPESYRAAGVEYNSVLPSTSAELLRRPDGRPYLRLTSDRGVQEPFVDVILELSWSTGRLVREYTLLFDPPSTTRMAQTPPGTAPVITPAPAAPSSLATAPAPRPAPAAPRVAEPSAPAVAARPSPQPAPSESAATARAPQGDEDEYLVKRGDTLSSIAAATRRPGVSLDQMLVALYRSNAHAFMGENMNRLKAGVVLDVPTADQAHGVSNSEARQIIRAQSADFGAYRERLASAAAPAAVEAPSRQAAGRVEATVQDRKEGAAATPDKLTLSKGAAGAQAPAAEERLSKAQEQKDAAARVAELSKNVQELERLSGAAAGANGTAGTSGGAAAPASAPVGITVPVTVPPAVAAAPAPAAAPESAEPASAVVAQAPAPAEAPAAAETPAAAEEAPAVIAEPAPAAPAAPTPAPVTADQPGMLDSLIDENPWALAVGGGLLALLAGLGVYRLTRRAKKDSGETSFLESRLQPDSFFGASGGQRIDTRDASGTSSSMSYSLSQLDAIGDVDPVAEADVYLAYGRDLQAEEILKEAMRSTPDRLAIRTKLLEVYAKRRDTKGFELLATQLFSLTSGDGEDWTKAQEMGRQIDPENPLYQPGGAPVTPDGSPVAVEPLSASTMPQSVLPTPSRFEAAQAVASAEEEPVVDSSNVDLDLDLGIDQPSPASAPAAAPARPNVTYAAPDLQTLDLDAPLDLPSLNTPAAAPTPAPSSASMDFDLSDISLDLHQAAPAPAASAPAASHDLDLGGIDLTSDDDGADPLARKLELAEEFRQIGDMEGARDLLQEVVAKADGALRSKAQGMLSSLG